MIPWRRAAVLIAILLAPPLPASVRVVAAQTADATSTSALPMVPARSLKFTVDEGTWVSLDVSPDGKRLVIELLGDLYLLPIEGGTATRLTAGPAFDAQPRFSPDGRTILFTSDRDGSEKVWLIAADGSASRAITAGSDQQFVSPEWAPDGKYVVVSRRDPSDTRPSLYRYDLDNGSSRKLIDGAVGAAFGADPRSLWATTIKPQDGASYFGAYQLVEYDLESRKSETRSALRGSGMRPALSPDGRWLTYATRSDTGTVWVLRDLQSNDEKVLHETPRYDEGEADDTRDALPGYAFTPDSRAIVLWLRGKLWRMEVPSGALSPILFQADVEQAAGALVRFQHRVPDDSIFVVRQIRDTRFSPNGRRIAFTALDRVWVADWPRARRAARVDTIRHARRLTRGDAAESHPSWSPDGRFVVYVAHTDRNSAALYRSSPDGRSQQRLTEESASFARPVYTPDGARIVVIRQRYQQGRRVSSDLVWIPAGGGGGNSTVITPDVREVDAPYFVAGDTSRVYFGATSVRWDGSDRIQHLRLAFDTRAFISPDGKRIALQQPEQLGNQRGKIPHVYHAALPAATRSDTPSVAIPGPLVRSPFPAEGEFMGWTPDGRSIHYSLGKSLFVHDVADSARLEAREVVVEARATRDRPRGALVMRGARIVTMNGDAVIERGDVLVTGNRIAAVGPAGTVSIPRGAHIVDATGRVIVPGFVDVHAHFRTPTDQHDPRPWEYAVNLAYGVTTQHDPQSQTTDIFSYADVVETGAILGPRIFSTGPAVERADNLTSLDRARAVLRPYARHFGVHTIKQYTVGERTRRQWLNLAAAEQRMSATVEGARDFKMAVTNMFDGYSGHEHNVAVAPLYEDVLRLIAFTGTIYTPTLLVNYGAPQAVHYFMARQDLHDDPKVRRFWPHGDLDVWTQRGRSRFRDDQFGFTRYAAQLARIVEHGGKVALGAHGTIQGIGAHWELWAMQSGGLSTHEALRAATIRGAEAIGLMADLGSIEPGKLADFLVLDRDPLADIRNTLSLRYVIKNGRMYDAETLDELWPRQRRSAWHADRAASVLH